MAMTEEDRYKEQQKALARTPQENALIGATYVLEDSRDLNWHKPIGVTKGVMTIEEAKKIRRENLSYESEMMGAALGSGILVFGLADLDDRGETLHDRTVYGVRVNPAREVIDRSTAQQLTDELYKKLKEFGVDMHRREVEVKEGGVSAMEKRG